MTTEQQTSSLGETFQELVKRLDDGIPCLTPSLLSLCLAGRWSLVVFKFVVPETLFLLPSFC